MRVVCQAENGHFVLWKLKKGGEWDLGQTLINRFKPLPLVVER